MHFALPIVALIASSTVDGVVVVTAGDGGADPGSATAVACPSGACAVASSGGGLHGFYKVTGFAANADVSVKLDSNQGNNAGCSPTSSVILPDDTELFGAQDQTCPDAVTKPADASGAFGFDWEGDVVPAGVLVFNPTGTGAGEGEGEGSTPCTQNTDCGADGFCKADGTCDKSATNCSSTSSGGATPWGSVAILAVPAVLWRARRR